MRELYLDSIKLITIKILAVASEWPQTYKTVPLIILNVSKWTSANNRLVCNTELYATIAFKSFKLIKRNIVSIALKKVTIIHKLKEISDDNENWKRNKQK